MKKRIFSLFLVISLLLSTLCGCGGMGLPTGGTTADTSESVTIPENSSFAIHFIDVGQADAALIMCKGQTMLIDGGNAEDSDLIYTYLQKHSITHLDYVVCTHAHEDHVGGLSGALTAATVGTVLSPVTDYDSKVFRNFAEKTRERGREITVPRAGDVYQVGDATVTVLGPQKDYDDTNNTSIVLRVAYGSTSFLFTGDMESSAEKDLVESGVELKSTVLKVGHHGSTTSTSYQFLRAVAPTYGVISVGTDNQYDHPNDDVLSRLRDADVTLYRTDLQGDIICTSNGSTLTFTTQKRAEQPINPTEPDKSGSGDASVTEYPYIGNLNTHKFHTATCSYLPAEENRIYFTTREEAIEYDYTACGSCKP